MPRRNRVVSLPDPYIIGENLRPDVQYANNGGYQATSGRTTVSTTIDPAAKTLVLIVAGQSNYTNVGNVAYTPVNSIVSQLHNFNVYNGALYQAVDPMLGTTWLTGGVTNAISCIGLRTADVLISNGKFTRVIIVPIAIGGTSSFSWSPSYSGQTVSNRYAVALARLAAAGITPGMTGVTFACIWGQGESDAATTASDYVANIRALIATGPSNVRWFINKQTMLSNVVNTTIQSAQASLVNGTQVFVGADADSVGSTFRNADVTHFLSTGLDQVNTLLIAAMAASGTPF